MYGGDELCEKSLRGWGIKTPGQSECDGKKGDPLILVIFSKNMLCLLHLSKHYH